MDLRTCLNTAAALLIMATFTGDCVFAWQHPFHERVARISQSTLPPGNYMIDWSGVFKGTTDPDFRREDCPWLNPSHKKDHWRIQASSDAAMNTDDRYLAGRRLGRAFHYLQDQTEASQNTKDRFSQVFSRPEAKSFADFRSVADLVLASIEKQSGGITSGQLSFSKYWRDGTREYSKCNDWPEIYSAVDNLKSGFDREMNKAMNAAPDRGPAIEVFHWYFASLVALQNQIIRLYAEDLKVDWRERILNGTPFKVVFKPSTPNMGTLKGGQTYTVYYRNGGFTCSGYNIAAGTNVAVTYSNANPAQDRISLWGRVFTYNKNNGEVFDPQYGLVGQLSQ
jgi:hypothetical protein